MANAKSTPTGGEPIRAIRLSDADWEELERIAERLGLLRGGVPSRAAAMRWMIDRERRESGNKID